MLEIFHTVPHVSKILWEGNVWKSLVACSQIEDYKKRVPQMLGLQCVCEDIPTLEAYLKGSIIPRNAAMDAPFSMPPHLTQVDPINQFKEREMSPKDILCCDTTFNWTTTTSRKNLHELAFETLKEDVLKGDDKSTLLLENMQGLLPASWFTSARTLIQDISGHRNLDDRATLSLIIAAWDDLYGIYTVS